MLNIVVLVVLGLKCLASPVIQQQETQQQPSSIESAITGYAVDLSAPTSLTAFQCMKRSLYNVAFIRGYSPSGQGEFDPYATFNIRNAFDAGLGTEVYMTPQAYSAKTGAQQFDELYSNLKNSGIDVRSVWIQVTSPINWLPSTSSNVAFLNDILSRANLYGLNIGVYTNFYDWSQITGSATVNNVMLWYWHVYGSGLFNESPANFTDFRAFGGWTVPAVKQFGQVESVCRIVVNRDVYSNSVSTYAGVNQNETSQQIKVGGLRLTSAAFVGKAEIKL